MACESNKDSEKIEKSIKVESANYNLKKEALALSRELNYPQEYLDSLEEDCAYSLYKIDSLKRLLQ